MEKWKQGTASLLIAAMLTAGTPLRTTVLAAEGGVVPELPAEISAAVKYVPYSIMLQGTDMDSENQLTFTMASGELPEGVEVRPNGEIYGIPKEAGSFTFTVQMEDSSHELQNADVTYTLEVLENTDENVDASTDMGYEVLDRVPDMESLNDCLNAYAELLHNYVPRYDDLNWKFSLGYVDEDDIPELFISEGSAHFCGVDVYTYYDNTAKLINHFSESGCLEYAPKQNLIDSFYQGMGYITNHFYCIKNGEGIPTISFDKYDGKSPYWKIDDIDVNEEEYENRLAEIVSNYDWTEFTYDDALVPSEENIRQMLEVPDGVIETNTYADQVFRSNGHIVEFIGLWLDGEKLVRDEDYIVEEGSVKATVFEKTFQRAGSGVHTLAQEFRVDGDQGKQLKRTAQNYRVQERRPVSSASVTVQTTTSTPTPAPVVTTPAPVTITPAPVVATPAPVTTTSSPVVITPTIVAVPDTTIPDTANVTPPIPTTPDTAEDITPVQWNNLQIGDIVTFTGTTHYYSANATTPNFCTPGRARVTGIYPEGRYPIQLIAIQGEGSTVYGWVDPADIMETDGSTNAEVLNVSGIVPGASVTVRSGARTYTGESLMWYVYTIPYTVMEVSGDRAVIGLNGVVTAAMNINDLILAE